MSVTVRIRRVREERIKVKYGTNARFQRNRGRAFRHFQASRRVSRGGFLSRQHRKYSPAPARRNCLSAMCDVPFRVRPPSAAPKRARVVISLSASRPRQTLFRSQPLHGEIDEGANFRGCLPPFGIYEIYRNRGRLEVQ